MPWPRGGADAPVDRPIYDFVSGSGNHRVSSLVGTSRVYTLNWNLLHQSTFDQINQFYLGLAGAGPFAYIDPSRPNLLSLNQASACSAWNDTTDFGLPGTGTLSANKVQTNIFRQFGGRSLRWLFASATSASFTLPNPYAGWFGYPVIPGKPYAFSFYATPDGIVDTSISCGAKISWLKADGTTISSTATANSTTTSGSWKPYLASAVAPALAAYVLPSVTVDGTTTAAGGSLYLDAFQLEQDSVQNDWAPGTGLNPVSILSLNEGMPADALMRISPSLVLRETK